MRAPTSRRHFRRPLQDRLLRTLLARILPNPALFRLAVIAARWQSRWPRSGPRRPYLARRHAAARTGAHSSAPASGAAYPPTQAARRDDRGLDHQPGKRRVALLTGCVASVLSPQINEAAARVLARQGIEVILAKGEGCCGALVHHLGREAEARAQARANIDAWTRDIKTGGLEAVLITASGCGTMVKNYGFIFRDDPAYAAKAARVSGLAQDVCEYLASLHLQPTQARALLSLTMGPARFSTARKSRASQKNSFPTWASWSWMCQKGISVAGPPAPTTSFSRA